MARLAPIGPWANKCLQNQGRTAFVDLSARRMKLVGIVPIRVDAGNTYSTLAKLKTPSLMTDEPV